MTDDPAGTERRDGSTPSFLRDQLGDDLRSLTYLIAGPPPWSRESSETLQAAGVPEEQIRPDRFSGY